ncbi:MAG TPA: GAF domain-containing SpoIIE family protein phosphatase [Streptosporangiaceae bacterium]
MAQRLGRDTAGGNGAAAGADAVGTDAAGTGADAAGTEAEAAGTVTGAAGTVTGAAGTETAGTETAGTETAAAAAVATAANGHRSWRRRQAPSPAVPAVAVTGRVDQGPELDLASNDPLVGYLLSEAGVVDITALDLDSPALDRLKAAGVALVVPLISSGDLIGLVNLGPRLSERDYSSEDRRLLNALAGYAAPALRVGQLVRQQQAEARHRERLQQELKIAQIIQQQFLPKSVPDLPSWHVAAFYRPARTVGGDFYDFIQLPDGRVMFVVGDVTDKGIPAALVMASTHALLRSAAPRLISPGAVLAHVNDLLCVDIPAHMFVTCLALVLDPATGQVEFANAGHDVPYVRTAGGVAELRARGMPLGLMPGMDYEEKSFRFQPGDCALLHSDGLAEAHAPDREMFGFPRVAELAGRGASGEALIDLCLTELGAFVGPDAEQEDDITLVSLERTMSAVYAGGDT